jgi:hypothetical protein
MRVILVHGIHTEGPSPVRNLIPILQAAAFEVIYPDYGWIASLETKFVNPIIVGCLLAFLKEGDRLIGHSNGAAICYDIMNRPECPQLAGASFINGALEQDIVRPACVPRIDVYWNQGDDITEAAKVEQELGLVDKVWGELGHAGYDGTDPTIPNFNCGATPGEPMVWGHSDWFTPGKVESWGQFYIGRNI